MSGAALCYGDSTGMHSLIRLRAAAANEDMSAGVAARAMADARAHPSAAPWIALGTLICTTGW